MAWAVRTGKVLHQIVARRHLGHLRAHASTQRKSLARPALKPLVLVGVFTEMNTMSAAAMASSTAVEKLRLRREPAPPQRPSRAHTQAACSDQHRPSGDALLVEVHNRDLEVGGRSAITAMVGPPTYPAPMQQILRTEDSVIGRSSMPRAVPPGYRQFFQGYPKASSNAGMASSAKVCSSASARSDLRRTQAFSAS